MFAYRGNNNSVSRNGDLGLCATCYMSPVLLHLGGLMLISHLLPRGGYYFNNLPSPSAFLYGNEQFYYDIEMPAIATH